MKLDVNNEDTHNWYVLSMPVADVRFDRRMLELMDSDHDGRIRVDEVLAAVAFLKENGVDVAELPLTPAEVDVKALDDVSARQVALDSAQPEKDDAAAIQAWETAGNGPSVAVLGEGTADAEMALSKVEPIVDEFFTPPDDMPLVTEVPDVVLPLADHLNPKYLGIVREFAEKCVRPICGDVDSLNRTQWRQIKDKLAAYRNWQAAKPVPFASAKKILDNEERLLRYKIGLPELLRNYRTMDSLYALDRQAIFQLGKLRIDARELSLCFHVTDEAAHAELAAQSRCCLIYVRLRRPSESETRTVCAVVTAGSLDGLYVGRNGIFQDRDGRDWEAVVTRVVASQTSLREAFWLPWKKLGTAIASMAEKFIGDKQLKNPTGVVSVAKGAQNSQKQQTSDATGTNGAALASSVAAIGIGIGMVGAAVASLTAALAAIRWWQSLIVAASVVLAVSLPSVLLAWMRLLRRDLGAILNASGWAVNRPMRFSLKLAKTFTRY